MGVVFPRKVGLVAGFSTGPALRGWMLLGLTVLSGCGGAPRTSFVAAQAAKAPISSKPAGAAPQTTLQNSIVDLQGVPLSGVADPALVLTRPQRPARSGDTALSPTPTGSMTSPRADHTSTLLPNGTVLVAGGVVPNDPSSGCNTSLSSAETYDPATGVFSPTGSMLDRRLGHTATLLPSGKVLVAGGHDLYLYNDSIGCAQDILDGAEVFDPATGTFASVGSMETSRVGHTATLLANGTVLITGGTTFVADASGYHYATLASAEIFDPATGAFHPTGSMGAARSGHTATLLPNGKVLVSGGVDDNGFLASAELYDPSTGSFTPTGSMAYPRANYQATLLLDGSVLVEGGLVSNEVLSLTAELYSSSTGLFVLTGSMQGARAGHTASLLPDGQVLVAGGLGGLGALSSVELFNPTSGADAFTLGSAMAGPRSNHAATVLSDGRVLITGGIDQNGNAVATAEIY